MRCQPRGDGRTQQPRGRENAPTTPHEGCAQQVEWGQAHSLSGIVGGRRRSDMPKARPCLVEPGAPSRLHLVFALSRGVLAPAHPLLPKHHAA